MEIGKTKRVLILYTGGTMGMMRATPESALAPVPGYLTTCIREMPEMSRSEMPSFDIIEYDPLLDSSAMTPADWVKIAKDIERSYESYDGFVVIMGTDTMAYASSALSFMLENLGKTVVFTGSQIPFAEVYNDARRNLIVSIIFSVSSLNLPEVFICFNDRLLRANRSVKVNSVGLTAFDSPNVPPLAKLGVFIDIHRDLVLPKPSEPFSVSTTLVPYVIVIKLVPGFDDESISAMIRHSTKLRAIVLEMYGTGNGPSKGPLLSAIHEAKEKGLLIVAVSQCLTGGVSLDSYSMGAEFKSAGVISAGDMTCEACVTKIAYLLGKYSDIETVAEMIPNPIRGEVTARDMTTSNAYFSKKGSMRDVGFGATHVPGTGMHARNQSFSHLADLTSI